MVLISPQVLQHRSRSKKTKDMVTKMIPNAARLHVSLHVTCLGHQPPTAWGKVENSTQFVLLSKNILLLPVVGRYLKLHCFL